MEVDQKVVEVDQKVVEVGQEVDPEVVEVVLGFHGAIIIEVLPYRYNCVDQDGDLLCW